MMLTVANKIKLIQPNQPIIRSAMFFGYLMGGQPFDEGMLGDDESLSVIGWRKYIVTISSNAVTMAREIPRGWLHHISNETGCPKKSSDV